MDLQGHDRGEEPGGEISRLLSSWRQGDVEALDRIFSASYPKLRQMASGLMRKERYAHTLGPRALVHDLYLRLRENEPVFVRDPHHFFVLAARAMRHLLVDHARRFQAKKRISVEDRVPLDEASVPAMMDEDGIVALHEALDHLGRRNPRQAKVVELHYFAGLTVSEVAGVLEVSTGTVSNDWKIARIWLHRRLTRG